MEIRFATMKEVKSITASIRNKKIDYNTPSMVKKDIEESRLIIAVEDNKILGQLALVDEPRFSYVAIKRLCVYNKKNKGKGIASALINYACNYTNKPIGASPWTNNLASISLFKKHGFEYQYTYLKNYNFYLKKC